jgi:hypothetical protein
MKTRSRSERIYFLEPKAARVTLVPQQVIAIIGVALIARPVFAQPPWERMSDRDEVMCVALVGALVLVLALTTMIRLRRWQPWVQAAAGVSTCIVALFLLRDTPDGTALVAGSAIVTLAMRQIDAIESAEDHGRHRGWRQPAARFRRGLRLVHSSDWPRSSDNDESILRERRSSGE